MRSALPAGRICRLVENALFVAERVTFIETAELDRFAQDCHRVVGEAEGEDMSGGWEIRDKEGKVVGEIAPKWESSTDHNRPKSLVEAIDDGSFFDGVALVIIIIVIIVIMAALYGK